MRWCYSLPTYVLLAAALAALGFARKNFARHDALSDDVYTPAALRRDMLAVAFVWLLHATLVTYGVIPT